MVSHKRIIKTRRLKYLRPPVDIVKGVGHFSVFCLREEHGEGPGGDGHHGEDEGGDDGVDVSQGGHGGGQRPAYLGDQRGGAHACSADCRGHNLT